MFKYFVLILIRFYQRFLSLDTGFGKMLVFSQPVCRHSPTCSQFTYEAVQTYGVLKGLFLGTKRIFGCSSLGNFEFQIKN